MSLKQFLDQTGLQELITKFTDWCKQSFLGKNDKASNASKLDVADIGNIYKPVFFNNGVPVACEHKLESDVPANAKFTDTVNTYVAGAGISINGNTINNAGVRSIGTGSVNGTISVNSNGTTLNVAVKGLGSAAYTNSNEYATANHNHDTAYSAKNHTHDSDYASKNHNHDSIYVSTVATGDNNGQIKFTKNGNPTNVNVKGLGSAAYTDSSNYALANHKHDSEYAPINHSHDSAYASKNYINEIVTAKRLSLQYGSISLTAQSSSGVSLTTQSISVSVFKLGANIYALRIPFYTMSAGEDISQIIGILSNDVKELFNNNPTNIIPLSGIFVNIPGSTGSTSIPSGTYLKTMVGTNNITFKYETPSRDVKIPETNLLLLAL